MFKSVAVLTLLLSTIATGCDQPSPAVPNPRTPHEVAHSSNVESMRALLNDGLNPNARSTAGETLLYRAVRGNQLEMAELLLDSGADVDLPETTTGRTPLFQAAFDGFHSGLQSVLIENDEVNRDAAAMVELLIGRGADVNARNIFDWTPLHDAVAGRNPHVVQILLRHGADPTAADNNGTSPIDLANRIGDANLIRAFIEHDIREQPSADRDG